MTITYVFLHGCYFFVCRFNNMFQVRQGALLEIMGGWDAEPRVTGALMRYYAGTRFDFSNSKKVCPFSTPQSSCNYLAIQCVSVSCAHDTLNVDSCVYDSDFILFNVNFKFRPTIRRIKRSPSTNRPRSGTGNCSVASMATQRRRSILLWTPRLR